MRKLIFRNFMFLGFVSLIAVTLVLSAVFYSRISSTVKSELQVRTRPFASLTAKSAKEQLHLVVAGDMRVTLIDKYGEVLFDNTVPQSEWENHGDRIEIQEALVSGEGESTRRSDTIGKETYYFAVRLADGSVLRSAKTISSVWSVYAQGIPVVLLALLTLAFFTYVAAGKLAKNVVAPLYEANPRKDMQAPYDELTPYTQTIAEQQKKIARDKERIARRSHTIDAIMENVAEGVILFDNEGRVLSLNKQAQEVLDVDDSFEGRASIELMRDFEFESLINRAISGERGSLAYTRENRDYRLIVSPADAVGVLVLILDMTDSIRAEQLRREFSGNVSHELKTPLTSIYGSAEMLKLGLVRPEDNLEFYGKMMDESSRLIALVEDIMLLSQLDEDKFESFEEEVDLAYVANSCIDELKYKAVQSEVEITVKGEAHTCARKSLMYELFSNLIENGIKYSNPGGKVEVELTQVGEHAHIKITDTGIGIKAEDQPRIFERFYRVDQSRSKETGGTGLGLAIVKHIVMLHDGSIKVSSDFGQGTQFEIVI